MKTLRLMNKLFRHGLTRQDQATLLEILKKICDYLLRTPSARRYVRFAYRKVFLQGIRLAKNRFLPQKAFHAPTIRPTVRQKDMPDYIMFGVIDWHFRHQRPQQLALALAKMGRRVFYISPNMIYDNRAGFKAEALDSAGLLFQIQLFVQGKPEFYHLAPAAGTCAQLELSMGEALLWADCQYSIALTQHPFWGEVSSKLPNSRLVYDCMDDHHAFHANPNGTLLPSLIGLEQSLIQNAELVITTSIALEDKFASPEKRRALIRNAADYDCFSKVPAKIYQDPKGRRIIGYYGAIAEWFDVDLLESLAREYSDCCILLIGRDTVNAQLRFKTYSNVILIGEVPYQNLPYYLYAFDVCLLPFKINPLTLATNPVKVYEYLSAGKPVVSVNLPEMEQFAGFVHVAINQHQFSAMVGSVLQESESEVLIERRKHFASGQTWMHRAERLIQEVESTIYDPLVSVIVVTYNNLQLTQDCLASLEEHSQYANLEIIVVDNASSDASPTFLREWVLKDARYRLILNNDNLGFAAANNQGLALAKGDYLVLLNNDTYVTPGWIRTLCRHLQEDKTIGLIGPVTNNIGNEAKIEISFGDRSDMLVKAASYTFRNMGKRYPLRTAAFFCVMMRRDIYERVGPLDEAFGKGFFEDDDYCRRVEQLGLRIACAEDVFIYHHLSASFNKLKRADRQILFENNKSIYEAKWGKWIPHCQRTTNMMEIVKR